MDDIIFLKIAGYNIKLTLDETEYILSKNEFKKDILDGYRGYILSNKPNRIDYQILVVLTTKVRVLTKNNHAYINFFYEEVRRKKIITYYSISQVQLFWVIKYILKKLLKERGFFLHASASCINNKAYIFLGNSGAGKSTITALLNQKHPSIGDDNIIIKKENGRFNFYQSPLFEKYFIYYRNLSRNSIGKVFFLHKADYIKIEKIEDKNLVLKKIASQFPHEKEDIKNQMSLLIEFVSKLDNFYDLYFTKDTTKLIQLFSSK